MVSLLFESSGVAQATPSEHSLSLNDRSLALPALWASHDCAHSGTLGSCEIAWSVRMSDELEKKRS